MSDGRRRRAKVVAATLLAVATAAISALLFGPDAWRAWRVRRALEAGDAPGAAIAYLALADARGTDDPDLLRRVCVIALADAIRSGDALYSGDGWLRTREPEVIAALRDRLPEGPADGQHAALAGRLAALGDASALERLRAHVTEQSSLGPLRVSLPVAAALAELGDPVARDWARRVLADGGAAEGAVSALGDAGDETDLDRLVAVLALHRHASGPWEASLRRATVRSIGRLGERHDALRARAAEPLADLLDDADVDVRIAAARALLRLDIHADRARAALEPVLVGPYVDAQGVLDAHAFEAATALDRAGDERGLALLRRHARASTDIYDIEPSATLSYLARERDPPDRVGAAAWARDHIDVGVRSRLTCIDLLAAAGDLGDLAVLRAHLAPAADDRASIPSTQTSWTTYTPPLWPDEASHAAAAILEILDRDAAPR